MELNLSTFLLEIINFLVLVWILKRFLYKPVLEVIRRREQDIENRVAESHKTQEQAVKLRGQYENRIADWEQEREKAREQLAQEIARARGQRMNELQQELEQEREKQAVIDQKNLDKQRHELELLALRQGAQFSTRLLSQGAGPETQSRLIEILLGDLQQLDDEQLTRIRAQWGEPLTRIRITSAYRVPDPQRDSLKNTLQKIIDTSLPIEYAEDESLVAGILIAIGAWSISMNLRDELKSFAEFHHETY